MFLIKLAMISCSRLPSSVGKVNMTCQIEYKTHKVATMKLWFQFHCNMSANTSNWEFSLEKCDPNFHNNFCEMWERKSTDRNLCKMVIDSCQVFCLKQINLQEEVRSTKPYYYRFYASHNSKNVVSKELGKIRYLKCECKYFDFGQEVKVSFPYLGKVDIQIGPFHDIPRLVDTTLNIAPSNNVSIKKSNDKRFEISGLNICPRYNITVELKTWPTCTNWKVKSILLDFLSEGLNVNDFFCKFNRTHINLNTSADSSSQFYYKLSFMNEMSIKNYTKEITLPSKWLKNELRNNITAFVKLCAHGC